MVESGFVLVHSYKRKEVPFSSLLHVNLLYIFSSTLLLLLMHGIIQCPKDLLLKILHMARLDL